MQPLNKYSKHIVSLINKKKLPSADSSSGVNPLVAELASWYEKFRNSIEYRDEEVILRASIERILKRRLALGGNGATTAKHLLQELVWARYLPESILTEEMIESLEKIIDFYLALKNGVVKSRSIKDAVMRPLTFHLMSAEIEGILNPNEVEDAISNYIFYILKKNIHATEEAEEEKNVQAFIAIRKAYAKDDIAFLQHELFSQYFGKITENPLDDVIEKFPEAYKTIEAQLSHPARYKILSYVKRQIPPFIILEDIMINSENFDALMQDEDALDEEIIATCKRKYKTISERVRRATIRSVIFILLSKVFFAFFVEGTYERIVYGGIQWFSLGLNIVIPTLIMIAVGLWIRTPGDKNSRIIVERIHKILFDPDPSVGRALQFPDSRKRPATAIEVVFSALWILAFLLSFGLVFLALSYLKSNIASQIIFIFFLAIVSFLAYRISITAKEYTVQRSVTVLTPIIDFFFTPVARVGRYLTEGISQINIFLFILDFIIETPFKGMVGFFDKWFFFLNTKREELG